MSNKTKTRTIFLNEVASNEWVESQKGKVLTEEHVKRCKIIGGESVDAYSPDGELVFKLLHNILPLDLCERVRPDMRMAGKKKDDHRGLYTGVIGFNAMGTESEPLCRKTEFTGKDVNRWGRVLEYCWACNEVYRRELPERYAYQRHLTYNTHPDFHIRGSAFTTGTVNFWDPEHNAQTPVHVDSQDLKEGFGVLSVLSSGDYEGGYLIFPKFGVGVDYRTGDVLLADVHQYHANAPILSKTDWHRIAIILYYKELIWFCGRN